MNIKKMKLPLIIILIGMAVAIASCFLTCILKEPTVKEHEFEYSVTYKLNGEVKTLEGIYKCGFSEYDNSGFVIARSYYGNHIQKGHEAGPHSFMIAQKDGFELYLIIELDESYLMGDRDVYRYVSGNVDPYFEAYDSEGYGVDVSETFNAEIISWEYPEPIENSFEIVGFSGLYAGSMLAMLIVGILTVIACIIFVKRDKDVRYKILDVLSIVANFIIGLVAIPVIAFIVWLLQITMSNEELIYQVFLCVPAFTAFTIAASIALRRKGFRVIGSIVQLVGPALFAAFIFAESIIYYLFF